VRERWGVVRRGRVGGGRREGMGRFVFLGMVGKWGDMVLILIGSTGYGREGGREGGKEGRWEGGRLTPIRAPAWVICWGRVESDAAQGIVITEGRTIARHIHRL